MKGLRTRHPKMGWTGALVTGVAAQAVTAESASQPSFLCLHQAITIPLGEVSSLFPDKTNKQSLSQDWECCSSKLTHSVKELLLSSASYLLTTALLVTTPEFTASRSGHSALKFPYKFIFCMKNLRALDLSFLMRIPLIKHVCILPDKLPCVI